ncbi:MAG: TonB family protein [Rhodobacteraceae bacterium]|nr:TonB family protein [Paracoccaceae bacterium]
MIRRSLAIAIAAIVLSLLAHGLGLRLSLPTLVRPAEQAPSSDAVELTNTFEDLAEAVTEPVEPEETAAPEPEPQPEPEPDELPPTSEALVASDNPTDTTSPDTGEAVEPEPAPAAEPEQAPAAEPEVTEPLTAEDLANPAPPLGDPDAAEPSTEETRPIEPEAAEPVAPPVLPDTAQIVAPVTTPVAPVVPITPSPDPAALPIVPLETETVEAQPEDQAPQTIQPDETETSADSTQAVASSLRPRLPERRPSQAQLGEADGTVESPLSRYNRDGTDLFAGLSAPSLADGLNFPIARNGGNATRTNYAGRVLMHLNRFPSGRVSARGSVRVMFEINPDGTLAWVQVIDSGVGSAIDLAARSQVRRASPFPVPPDGKSHRLSFVYSSK